MNAAVASDERLRLASGLRKLLAAVESGDDAAVETGLAELLRAREEGLFVHLARLTRELHRALGELGLDSRLSDLAGSGIPDACGRLDYVVQVTEQAAHRTLDLVDSSRVLAADILTHATALPKSPARQTILDDTEKLRHQLTELAQAQEYQDIAGQTIKRVIGLVRSVEQALLDLLRAAGTRPSTAAMKPVAPRGLEGPAMPGTGHSQQDADDLLASLGF
ncbi:protein phosphatase CheZ [Solimonas sp. SE-A11]|uniref:protein phosphatase CheZ n=1 Tax=Solimonas sp. SE-A11 TaxID=3054954 RepID=UPI00259CDD11|nr:protein phosphatase CheZ [Solimonas sp. SE-A11]MDM4770778.1 protein phosphatase CheZ [Solimonas sp. SE-A11]